MLQWREGSVTVCALFAPGSREGPREGGVNPPRPRHCNRGRNPRVPLAGQAGKARGVGRSESQETCPGAIRSPVFEGGPGQMAASLFIIGGARSGKSRFASERFSADTRIVFVATAEARDEDMAKRIARHRA